MGNVLGDRRPVTVRIITDPGLYVSGHPALCNIVSAFHQARSVGLPQPSVRAEKPLAEKSGSLRSLRALIAHPDGRHVLNRTGSYPARAHSRRTSRAQASGDCGCKGQGSGDVIVVELMMLGQPDGTRTEMLGLFAQFQGERVKSRRVLPPSGWVAQVEMKTHLERDLL